MRYSDETLDLIRARLPVSQIVGRRVRLKKVGREFIGLCCFHADKKPSLTVSDQKDLFHCFPCGATGDQFTFLMKTEGLEFPEAVQRLAQEAGVTLPTHDAEYERREAKRRTLMEVIDEAAASYRNAMTPAALSYLHGRSITDDQIEAFGIGFAPDDRAYLKSKMDAETQSLAVEAGLLVTGDDVPVSYDRFRNRIVFPIHDDRGRGVGFGGRDLSGQSPAKYLNTSETPIFDKGRILYNANRARQPAQADDSKGVVVVEGYTGTIASVAAGFPATVATMGTALSPAHMQSLWRMSDCPVIAFDGDSAGQMASRRAIATALPLMIPGRSLKIAALPVGMDPDDVVRKRSAQAYVDVIGGAVRLVDALWSFESAGRILSVPDDRAALEASLIAAVDTIPDARLRDQYRREYRDRIRAIPMRQRRPLRSNSDSQHSMSIGNINLASPPKVGGMNLRAAMLILAIVRAPSAALRACETLVADKRLAGEAGDVVRRALDVLAELPDATSDDLLCALARGGLGASLDAARDLCHKNGIVSLDTGGSEDAALKMLAMH